MTQNQIAYWKLQEDKRHNTVTEKELNRTNKANEGIKSRTNAINYELGTGNLAELNRSNIAKEYENYRTHTVTENEQQRTNKANEQLKAQSNQNQSRANEINALRAATEMYNADTGRINANTNIANLSEVIQHNREQERLQQEVNDETKRRNTANISRDNLQAATSAGRSSTQNMTDLMSVLEQNRHNTTVENETKRNNLINQQLEAAGLLETINNNKARNQISLISNLSPSVRIGGSR